MVELSIIPKIRKSQQWQSKVLVGIGCCVVCLGLFLLYLANRNKKATEDDKAKEYNLTQLTRQIEFQNLTIRSLTIALQERTEQDSIRNEASKHVLAIIPELKPLLLTIEKKYDTKIGTYRINGPGDAQLYVSREAARIRSLKVERP